ncbi:MAG: hypothetical protein H0U85_05415 [Gemmatimonadales bacterium]|nr:hypothetical protein [Gemmatimonadales bacterium]
MKFALMIGVIAIAGSAACATRAVVASPCTANDSVSGTPVPCYASGDSVTGTPANLSVTAQAGGQAVALQSISVVCVDVALKSRVSCRLAIVTDRKAASATMMMKADSVSGTPAQ